MTRKTEPLIAWGLRVGGQLPYIGYQVSHRKEEIDCTEKYHSAVKVAVIPLREYRRLLALDAKNNERTPQ